MALLAPKPQYPKMIGASQSLRVISTIRIFTEFSRGDVELSRCDCVRPAALFTARLALQFDLEFTSCVQSIWAADGPDEDRVLVGEFIGMRDRH